ncbi:MAG: hypothetical protein U9R58_06035 [Chloroflexota bacterium]|nr:hypothetical protein [Chloroflexota bacterium]
MSDVSGAQHTPALPTGVPGSLMIPPPGMRVDEYTADAQNNSSKKVILIDIEVTQIAAELEKGNEQADFSSR